MNDKLLKLLSEVFEVKESDINIDMTKEDIDNWDSLKQMDLVVSIEKEYGIELEMEEIVNLNSIKAIVEVIESKT
jgi:acyl carrier protein